MGVWLQVWEGPARETAQVLVETSDPAIIELVRRALSARLDGADRVRKAPTRRLQGQAEVKIRTLEARGDE
jgi:hypothetical protein